MVAREARFRRMVAFVREIWERIEETWESEESGAIKAPRTRVGRLRGMGVIGIRVLSELKACKVGEGAFRV